MNEENTTDIGIVLRQARENAEISMGDVAKQLGITKATLSRIETGAIGVTVDRIARLAEIYRISLADLLEGSFKMAPSCIDLDRLHATVKLVHEVIEELQVHPSPEKIADVITLAYSGKLWSSETKPPNNLLRDEISLVFKP